MLTLTKTWPPTNEMTFLRIDDGTSVFEHVITSRELKEIKKVVDARYKEIIEFRKYRPGGKYGTYTTSPPKNPKAL